LALRANVTHNHVLHDHVVIVTIDTLAIPRVADSERIEIDPLGDTHDGIIHVNAAAVTPHLDTLCCRIIDGGRAELRCRDGNLRLADTVGVPGGAGRRGRNQQTAAGLTFLALNPDDK
jgi:hypothetical protein